MAKLGHQLFAKSSLWLAKTYQRCFGNAIIDILEAEPDLTDLQVANALIDWFEPEPLVIHEPIRTSMSWDMTDYSVSTGEIQSCYLHEAEVRYSGTLDLWRLTGNADHRYATRVSAGLKIARLRAMRSDRNVDQFRLTVRADLDAARMEATRQGSAIDYFRTYLLDMVEQVFKHHDIGGLRDEARTRSRRASRLVVE